MYYPVVHGRTSERLALGSVREKILAADNVRPLMIPVRDNKPSDGSGIKNCRLFIDRLSRGAIPYYLLTTPYAAKVPYGQAEIIGLRKKFDKNGASTPVVAVTRDKPLTELRSEISALGGEKFSVLHVQAASDPARMSALLKGFQKRLVSHFFYEKGSSIAYRDDYKESPRILIRDGFEKQDRNSGYEPNDAQKYSDLPFTYRKLGFDGHGDHTICGEVHIPGGGPAYAVAIHLTFAAPLGGPHRRIDIRHFLSDTQDLSDSESTKVAQALKKLVAFYVVNRSELAYSEACEQLYAAYKSKNYPRLAKIKQRSIEHHLETMIDLDL